MQPGGATAHGRDISVEGKYLFRDGRKLLLRGVTYGTFAPGVDGSGYPLPHVVERDFALMAAVGVNAVRVYTVPPRWLLDLAAAHGLVVLVGLPWEQHVVLDERARRASIERRVREGVRACAGHPAVLGYAVGNEIPAPMVRWHGRARVERFLRRLIAAVRDEDDALVSYVNFPSTEYLEVPTVDFACLNVYLEQRERMAAYLARLQNLAGDLPLLMAEIGLDSRRNGPQAQADALAWQVETAFDAGAAGTFVFAWTDEWHRGGFEIDDWDFGLTDRARQPKPALDRVASAYAHAPFGARADWPRVSVVVCTYNGARTLDETLTAAGRLDYPDYEVMVVSDGSTDASADIARAHGVQLIETPNRGLSSARNTGMAAATGEIVAYVDDDARPDPDWLRHLAAAMQDGGYAAAGGPNVPPAGDGWVADAVALSPGGPAHVLVSDRDAEHLPGCNLAIRRSALQSIGGFDPHFRIAGDDVDVCWRLQDRGHKLGFAAGATVLHHRRSTVRAYLRQQRNYGAAEAMLERKWPERYNAAGHIPWEGRVYAPGLRDGSATRRGRVYFGVWGTAFFQAVYRPAPSVLSALPGVPEWYLLVLALAATAALGALWAPLLLAFPLLALVLGATVADATLSARAACAALTTRRPGRERRRIRALTTLLHLLQPGARLAGRLATGLTLWRRRGGARAHLPRPRNLALWSEEWTAAEDRLADVETRLGTAQAVTKRGGPYDRFDLQVRAGVAAHARLRMAIEEHGAGRQLIRFRVWPHFRAPVAALIAGLLIPGLAALTAGALVPAAALLAVTGLLGLMAVQDAALAVGAAVGAIDRPRRLALVDARETIARRPPATELERAGSG